MSSSSPQTPRITVFSTRPNLGSAKTDPKSPIFGHYENNRDSTEWSRSMEENGSLSPEAGKTESLARGESGDCSGLRGRDIALHMALLEAKLSDEAHATARLSLAVSEYEKRIFEKEREIEILRLEKQDIEVERHGLKEQLEITSKHLDTIEISFNDVHEKYERAKQTIQILHQNVETLKDSLAEHDLCISQKHEQFLKLKEHAMEKMDFANSQLDLIERKYSLETSKLRAALKEAELGARSLSEQLEQRNRDNAELTSICDGLIEKLDFQKETGSESGPIQSELIAKLKF